ncbi:1,2-phenylacetyl-CoA epoxidase subunit PaaC [Streptomyces sp. NBC_01216]|uniref:1,2-phenylacetyl-CoA epoxidase subunit PaaC n=1 Tax=unclassified Streptomyces TaxID=2593676 RepID=UPI002E0E2C5E|nr:phenylacetate-CoA oxygenase subunit PaaC [Streptomyces sp. NBC_01216]
MSSSTAPAVQLDLAEYVVRLGDDALVLSQRLCEWVTRSPTIEEDLAFANLALDLLGHARTLLDHAGRLDGTGRGEDDFAFDRTERDFRNTLLVELPRGDFAFTIARQLVYAHYSALLWTALESCADEVLAAFGARAAREVEYHRLHAAQWTVRLGRGTAESRLRMQRGLDEVWPYADELFASDALSDRLDAGGIVIAPAGLRSDWQRAVSAVIEEARLSPPRPSWRASGGRTGLHSEAFGPLLAELQAVRRQHPGGTW